MFVDAGQDPGKRPSDRIKGNSRMKTEEDARRREREDERVKKEEERINGQLPENYIAG